jgi:hypothetical protein
MRTHKRVHIVGCGGVVAVVETPVCNSHYVVLGLPEECTPEDVESAYSKTLAELDSLWGRLWLQFTRGSNRAAADAAYQTLKDPALRQAHDAQLKRCREDPRLPAPPTW